MKRNAIAKDEGSDGMAPTYKSGGRIERAKKNDLLN